MVMQRVAVLGATGSIGASALDVIARHPDRWDYHRPDGSLHSTVPRGAAHPAHPLGQGATS